MTIFWLLALTMTLLAVAVVVWPLYMNRRETVVSGPTRETINIALYRDRLAELEAERETGALSDEQFEQARLEMQQDLLENVTPDQPQPVNEQRPPLQLTLTLAITLPVLAGGIYLWLGSPGAIDEIAAQGNFAQHQSGNDMQSMDEAISRLRARLANNPDNIENWLLLGRSLMMQQQYGAAADAYGEAVRHFGEHPELLALYAEALTMSQGRVSGRPEALALQALELDPDTIIALWLVGYAATERHDFATAITHWERLLPLLPPQERMTRMVEESLAEARRQLGAGQP